MLVVYGLQDYDRADLPRIRLDNLYAEAAPSSPSQTALLMRPGLEAFRDIGAGPIRGLYGQPGALGGSLFAVSGTSLYKDAALLGTISGTARVSMASSSSQMLIANDGTLRITDGATVSNVAFPDSAAVTSVAFINGYFLAARANSQRFYWSAILDGSSWDPLDYASAERAPDNLVAIWVVSDQVWLFGETTTEVWVPTGDGDVPFQRVDGRLYDQGCLSRDTVAKLDNSIFWVGTDFKVYRGDSQPLRVSGHSIEQAIEASDVSDLRAWVYPWNGSLFYTLTTSSGTFQFNVATQQWNTVSSYGRGFWRAHLGLFYDGQVIAGDDELGRLWKLNGSLFEDGGDVVERRWTVLMDEQLMIDNMVLDVSTGEATILQPEQVCEFRVSRDQGSTFGDWRQMSLGLTGQYRKRVAARRIGLIDGDGGLIDYRMTDPSIFRVSSIRLNEGLAGRSRP
jgi:hypothetical protein